MAKLFIAFVLKTASILRFSLSPRISYSLRGKVTLSVLVCSSLVTLVVTGLQLTYAYEIAFSQIHQRWNEVEQSRVETLSKVLWNLDTTLLKTSLQGITTLQDVQYAKVIEGSELPDKIGETTFRYGTPDTKLPIIFHLKLFHVVDDRESTASLPAGTEDGQRETVSAS